MEPFGIGMAGLGVAGLSTLGAFGLAFRQRRRRRLLRETAATGTTPEARAPRGVADRLEALGAAQAELGLRLDTLAAEMTTGVRAPEERLQAMAGQLVGLIRDKNAALDRLAERLTALEGAENPFAEIVEQLTRLYAQKDATVETVFARLAPLEARLAALEARRDPEAEAASTEARAAARLAADATALFADRIAALEARLPRPGATPAAAPGAPGPAADTDLAAIWALPGVVSLHGSRGGG